MITGADIHIQSDIGGEDLAHALRHALVDGPFAVTAVDSVGPHQHRCTFSVRRDGLAIGYRNIIELQHRLAPQFDIVRVERRAVSAG